jgi:alpha-mannosidase
MKQRKTLHLICQAHLDPVWIWPRRDGYSEALTTMASAVQFLESEPDMKFTRSSAAVYRWVLESDPELFARIRKLVRAGRWEVVNGWEVQPDCNLPLGESFIRQSLYGKQWFREHLGVDVTIGYNVDTFGHAGNLPQILRLSGFDAYVCMRPFNDPAGQPYPNLFWWESPDGSRVLCWRIPRAYGQEPHASADHLEASIRLEAESNFVKGIRHAPFFLGVGNHGGGPTRRQIDRIRRLQEDADLPELRFSTMREYFDTVCGEEGFGDIPVHREGIQYINVGCYASHGLIKRACRRTERQLLKAESAASMVELAGLSAPKLDKAVHLSAWRSVLFNQFHDILGGTCIQSADESILDQFGHAGHIAEASVDRSLHALSRKVDTSWVEKGALMLFNPLPWERRASVAFDTFVEPTGEQPITHLQDAAGKRYPIQWAASEACFGPMGMKWRKLHATVTLPALGYRAFAMAEGRAPRLTAFKPKHGRVNRRRAGLSHLGLSGKENLLAGAIRLQVLEDSGDTWGHRLTKYDEVLGEPELLETKVLESGPLVRVVRQVAQWKQSRIRLYATFHRDRPEVELRIAVNWQEPRELLRLVVPTRFKDAKILVSEPGGRVLREPDGREKPATEWVAIGGKVAGKSRSVGLVSDRPISYYCKAGEIGIALARSSFYAHHQPNTVKDPLENPYLDIGERDCRLALIAAAGAPGNLDLHRLAWEHDVPAERVVDHGHAGVLPAEGSFLSIAPESVSFHALKPSEDGRALVLRIQETHGRQTSARVNVAGKRALAWEGELKPFEIRTLRIPVSGRERTIRSTGIFETS